MHSKRVNIIGGGLSGVECALYLADRGIDVTIYEMRPKKMTPAHRTGYLAELVCSNSLKSEEITNAHGLLKAEMKILGSTLLSFAEKHRVPGGKALVVDRERFSKDITEFTEKVCQVIREEKGIDELDGTVVVAGGPLASEKITHSLKKYTGEYLYFYDAVSPIVSFESIDMDWAFMGSRYGAGEDYINCPLTREEYYGFVEALLNAEKHIPHIKEDLFFEGCLPIEEMARRGKETLRFSLMKPVGLKIPEKFKNTFAIVQLRKENREGTMWNIVGFQTRLKIGEQKRVFRMIPCLKRADFLRYGKIHRNTYINSPEVLDRYLKLMENVYVIGTLTGVEGYVEAMATGLLTGINIYREIIGKEPLLPPEGTMMRGLMNYLHDKKKDFQPMNANFGLLPSVHGRGKEKRKIAAGRAIRLIDEWRRDYGI